VLTGFAILGLGHPGFWLPGLGLEKAALRDGPMEIATDIEVAGYRLGDLPYDDAEEIIRDLERHSQETRPTRPIEKA
jgi:hypothetical protein